MNLETAPSDFGGYLYQRAAIGEPTNDRSSLRRRASQHTTSIARGLDCCRRSVSFGMSDHVLEGNDLGGRGFV